MFHIVKGRILHPYLEWTIMTHLHIFIVCLLVSIEKLLSHLQSNQILRELSVSIIAGGILMAMATIDYFGLLLTVVSLAIIPHLLFYILIFL